MAGRLQELRKARDERAKSRKADTVASPSMAIGGAGLGEPAGEMTLQEMDAPAAPAGSNDGLPKTSRGGKKNNNKKKRKKRKAKK